MATRPKRPRVIRRPTPAVDLDGRDIVLVPVANSDQPAKLFRETFERMLKLRLTVNWSVTKSGHVRLRHGRESGLCVGRLIMEARTGQSVRFIDRNPLNLRLDNMYLKPGKGSDNEYWAVSLAQNLAWHREQREKRLAGLGELDRLLAEEEDEELHHGQWPHSDIAPQ